MNQTQKAYNYMKDRILQGHYKPSEKLVESELAKNIGVSRNTIKKALLDLEKEQLVTIEVNKGAKIRSFSVDEVVNYLEIRELLEGLIIRSAVERITSDELESLRRYLKKMEEAVEQNSFENYPKYNKEFHAVIYQASRNKQAVEMASMIKTQLIRYHFKIILLPNRSQTSAIEHAEIFRNIESRNVDGAEEAMKAHIRNVRHAITKYYEYVVPW